MLLKTQILIHGSHQGTTTLWSVNLYRKLMLLEYESSFIDSEPDWQNNVTRLRQSLSDMPSERVAVVLAYIIKE